MEGWPYARIVGTIGSAAAAFLTYDVAPVVTLFLVIVAAILAGILSARYVTLDVKRVIDREFAAHLEKFHREQTSNVSSVIADPRRPPR